MKRLLLLLLCLTAFTVSASADTGPKPLISIRVENAPEELYYLDLIEAEEYPTEDYDGLRQEEYAALDPHLLSSLRAAIPEGFHGCLSEGQPFGPPVWGSLTPVSTTKDGALLHNFRYSGVPEEYSILLVTKSGDIFLSEPLQRHALQISVTLDYASRTASSPSPALAYLLQFLATLLPTLFLEFLLLPLFGLGKERRNLFIVFLVNLLTQGALALYFSYSAVRYGVNFSYYFLLIPAEAVILTVESLIYRTA